MGLPALAVAPRPSAGGSCIVLRLTGGASHLDTWDLKPDAPASMRSPFRPMRTNVPGVEISEIFPRLAQRADRFAIRRGVYRTGPAVHEAGRLLADVATSAPPAPARTADRARYGWNRFGQSCWQACRQVESGERLVVVDMFPSVYGAATWDAHGTEPFSSLAAYRDVVGPMFDIAFSALLDDLSERGLWQDTLVVAAGEFGRSPRLNLAGGRDHWPECYSVLLAGGGVPGGQVIGSSDATGAAPRDNAVESADLEASIRERL